MDINPDYIRDIVNHMIEHWFYCNDDISIDIYEQVLINEEKLGQMGRDIGGKTEGFFGRVGHLTAGLSRFLP